MLHEFISTHRADLIERCRLAVQQRYKSSNPSELVSGVPIFIDQLIRTLTVEQSAAPQRSRAISGNSNGSPSEIGDSAAQHGRALSQHGFTVDQVVHNYGDLCQAITGLAFEQDVPISVDEFRTLNRCLDNGIADAVTAFSEQRDTTTNEKGVEALNERLGFLGHELRNLIHTAMVAVSAIKTGNVGLSGATGAVLDRSLLGLRTLVDRTLADVRATAGLPVTLKRIAVADLIAEVRTSAALEAHARGCQLVVAEIDRDLEVNGDRDLLLSAVGNLLQNAFKFSRRNTDVALNAYATADRVLIDIKDHCGGLPPGAAEKMFKPFAQSGTDTSGLGLGLSITRRSVEANHGFVRVRDVPGSGCVFTIDLPRLSLKPVAADGPLKPKLH